MSYSNIIILPADSGIRLDRWLKRHFSYLSYFTCQKLIRTGQIRLDGHRTSNDVLLQAGQCLRLPPSIIEEKKSISPKSSVLPSIIPQKWHPLITQAILYEDESILILNKPAGLAVQGGTNTQISLDALLKALPVTNALQYRLTHRLDKDTSGVLIIAKTAEEAAHLTNQFKLNKIQKEYWACTIGNFPSSEGIINLPLLKKSGTLGEKMEIDHLKGLPACTHYKVIDIQENLSFVKFYPRTGRTHQIRLHAATLGSPIVGDGKYGGKQAHPFAKRVRLQLHARQISFESSKGKEYTIIAPLPRDMSDFFQTIGFKNFVSKE